MEREASGADTRGSGPVAPRAEHPACDRLELLLASALREKLLGGRFFVKVPRDTDVVVVGRGAVEPADGLEVGDNHQERKHRRRDSDQPALTAPRSCQLHHQGAIGAEPGTARGVSDMACRYFSDSQPSRSATSAAPRLTRRSPGETRSSTSR